MRQLACSAELEPADRDEAQAGEFVGVRAGYPQDCFRCEHIPEVERLAECEQAERCALVADDGADLDVVQLFGERSGRLSPAFGGPDRQEREELVLVFDGLGLVYADHKEVAVHLLDVVRGFAGMRHTIDVRAATREIVEADASFDGGDEGGRSFDHLALAELGGGGSENFMQSLCVHWAP